MPRNQCVMVLLNTAAYIGINSDHFLFLSLKWDSSIHWCNRSVRSVIPYTQSTAMKTFRPYQLATILIAIIVITGFWPSYYGLILSGSLDVAPFVHLHNAVFLGWVGLLFLQASLVSGGRTDLHRKTGILGVVLGFLVLSGLRIPISQTEAWLSIARVLTGSA